MAITIEAEFIKQVVNKAGVLSLTFNCRDYTKAVRLLQTLEKDTKISYDNKVLGEGFRLNRFTVNYDGTCGFIYHVFLENTDPRAIAGLCGTEGVFDYEVAGEE